MGLHTRAWRFLDERGGLASLIAHAKEKEVPVGRFSVWYYFGGVTLFLFIIQIVTGLLLLMYYQPGENAYESVRGIVTRVPHGGLIRSIHCWSAHLMILSLVIHAWSVFFMKAYRRPRELTWVTGIALLGLVLGFGFSGYLLPWNELAFFATSVGTDVLKSVPLIGQGLLEILRGGRDVSIATLHRFFAFHVCLLPLATLGVLGVHLLLVQVHGMSRPIEPDGAPRKTLRFFPDFALRDLLLWVFVLNIVGTLAVLLPNGLGVPGIEWELGKKADPLMPAPPGIKPEWYFLWVFQLLREMPSHFAGIEGPTICLFILSIVGAVVVLVPFLDRSAARGERSPRVTWLGAASLLAVIFLTVKGWDAPASTAAIASLVALIGLALIRWRMRLAVALLAIALLPAVARADDEWPRGFRELIEAKENGAAVVSPEAVARFRVLPDHSKQAFFDAVKGDLLSSPRQLAALLALDLDDRRVELLVKDKCVLCHTNPDAQQEARTLFGLGGPNDLRAVLADTHARKGLWCAGCHGGDPQKDAMTADIYARWPKKTERADKRWVPDFCAKCHADPRVIREHLPSLPIDQILKYRASPHGELLAKGDARAPQCVTCHGAHGILPSANPASRTFAEKVPSLCGECHARADVARVGSGTELADYTRSVHGHALLEKHDRGAPSCAVCHGAHLATPRPNAGAPVCRTCHAREAELFDGSPHKRAFETHAHAECTTCHGSHAIDKPSDRLIATTPGALCSECHLKDKAKPLCFESAAKIAKSLAKARDDVDATKLAIARADALGVDTADLRAELATEEEAVVDMRSRIHSFSPAEFESAAKKSGAAAESTAREAARLSEDARSRRMWLLSSTGVLLVMMAALAMKIRSLERAH